MSGTKVVAHVEIKVECLLGIQLKRRPLDLVDEEVQNCYDDCEDLSKEESTSLTATVAFSGSARNMQVRSSMLCIETGLLMVESEPVVLVPSMILSGDPNSASTLDCTFAWPSNDDQPHLVITDIAMPTRNSPLSPSATAASRMAHVAFQSNSPRPDTIYASAPNPTSIPPNHIGHHASWSEDTPDILEISVRVGDDKGVAFLVFSGSLGSDETVAVELPIRRPHANIESVFTEESRLRLLVRISDTKRPHGHALPTDVPTSVATSTSSASSLSASCRDSDHTMDPQHQPRTMSPPPMIAPTKSMLEAQIGPLLKKIHQQEQEAWELHRARKANFVVSLHPGDDVPRRPFRAFCAAAYWNWEHIRELISACHGATYSGGAGARNNDFACDSSTIGTHDSWQL